MQLATREYPCDNSFTQYASQVGTHFSHQPINAIESYKSVYVCQPAPSLPALSRLLSRGSFLIDEEGMVRHQVINDLPLGRNVDEMLRMVDALAFHQEHGEVCPAGWTEGKAGMDASPEGVAKYLSEEADKL